MKTIMQISLLFFYLIFNSVFGQDFKVSPLINIPGDNFEYDVLSSKDGFASSESYICWVNKIDTIYTLYLKQISPIFGTNIIVKSSTEIIANPKIAYSRDNTGFHLAWQIKKDSIWQVYYQNMKSNVVDNETLLLDSLKNSPQISLSTHRLAWIDEGDLFFMELYSDNKDPILVDSGGCSYPDLMKDDLSNNVTMLYEKLTLDSVKICLADYYDIRNPKFEYEILSRNKLNGKPQFGFNYSFAFQTYDNDVWKSEYSEMIGVESQITKNENYNIENPIVFTYDSPTCCVSNEPLTPFFLAFDSDSLRDNREIFIKPFYYGEIDDSLINISNDSGDDYDPSISYLFRSDTVFVSIIWKHTENNKTDLWIAKSVFVSIISDVKNEESEINNYHLSQNYPNPFNPTTTIKYEIPAQNISGITNLVQLIVYDVLGNEITTLVNEHQSQGSYSIEFDASSLPSGVYFYRLNYGDKSITNKMLLLK